ncbi:hypothetical protein MNEG_11071 [Monoraphidium neglectum]|uniref:CS domain-containing protein n=1 Tax=Monoraphidium neglectum TaxID=145388 RepID=A0A0D2KMD5_9CHLO|nr:hypothetical protein MNEG_11071 [Monoraphidium neglectum]KIY96893.1 hypothetical protein MNEG_11071 [Monoraphidium neglectum]|eukprot:XP_013895913.1 hypothetical protein MNEG_11071 [Monoraphidium neglectum]
MSSGAPAERPDKHPFCMSRVHYTSPSGAGGGGGGGGGAAVWFEPAEGGCRWRQTASEVEIICTRVPPQLPAARLEVTFEPYRLRVTDRVTREVYLEGALERGVVTSECVWTHAGGEGEDGCLLTLAKMNLELFERPWRHSECWWPRLFAGDAAVIAWDDADKDYSDLPHEIEALRLREEALEEAQRHVAAGDKRTRARLQDQEEGRRRRRHERLAALKSACWRAAAAAAAAAPSGAAAAPAAAGVA